MFFYSFANVILLSTAQLKQLTNMNNAVELELTANKLLLKESKSEVDQCRALVAELKQKLNDTEALVVAKDSAETERILSCEVSLRQELQGDFDKVRKVLEDEKFALEARCEELSKTLMESDKERKRYNPVL